jgi:hypothetical protein
MSRGKAAPSNNGGDVYQGPAGGSRGKIGVGRLNSGSRKTPLVSNGVVGAGYGSKSYLSAPGANTGGSGAPGLNAFNIPKYG